MKKWGSNHSPTADDNIEQTDMNQPIDVPVLVNDLDQDGEVLNPLFIVSDCCNGVMRIIGKDVAIYTLCCHCYCYYYFLQIVVTFDRCWPKRLTIKSFSHKQNITIILMINISRSVYVIHATYVLWLKTMRYIVMGLPKLNPNT